MKKKLILLTTFALVALLIAGGTMAWFTHNPAPVTNIFNAGTVKIEVNENEFETIENVNPGDDYDKKITIVSKGTKATYVRVKLIPEWSNSKNKGNYAIKDTKLTVYGPDKKYPDGLWKVKCEKCNKEIPWWEWIGHKGNYNKTCYDSWHKYDRKHSVGDDDKWVYHEGWFYYKEILTQNKETAPLIEQVYFDGKTIDNDYQGAKFSLEVVAEAVQASHQAYKHVWGLNKLPEGVAEYQAKN